MERRCVDCPPGQSRPRPAPHGGPRSARCATHYRDFKEAQREAARGRRLLDTYGITLEQYDALYAAQGGFCYICRRARGTGKKKLAVDHDHKTEYVRGLACSTCNNILGHFRDDPEAFRRGAYYLENPPAFDVIGMVKPNGTD